MFEKLNKNLLKAQLVVASRFLIVCQNSQESSRMFGRPNRLFCFSCKKGVLDIADTSIINHLHNYSWSFGGHD